MNNEFEQIVPWNGAQDTGRDVRLKWQRNFERIKSNFEEIIALLQQVTPSELSKMFLRKDQEDGTNFLLKFGEFIDSMSAGAGAGIFPDGRGQFEKIEVRSALVVLELIYNRLSAMEGDYSFSTSGTIETVTLEADGTYTLKMRRRWEHDFTAFREHDIIYGVVNDLASEDGGYYASWLRVLSVDTVANTLSATLYPDAEVPGGVNHAPEPLMVVTQRGNPVDETRQGWWYLSTTEWCLCMLGGVTKPILETDNYHVIVGRLKHLELFDNLPINYLRSYIFVSGLVVQDIFRVNFQGTLPRVANNRGAWSLAVAQYTNALMAERFSRAMWVLGEVMGKKFGARLASLLLQERGFAGGNDLKLTHEQLAGHLGCMREAVSRTLKYFEEEGLVSLFRGGIRIENVAGLRELAGE